MTLQQRVPFCRNLRLACNRPHRTEDPTKRSGIEGREVSSARLPRDGFLRTQPSDTSTRASTDLPHSFLSVSQSHTHILVLYYFLLICKSSFFYPHHSPNQNWTRYWLHTASRATVVYTVALLLAALRHERLRFGSCFRFLVRVLCLFDGLCNPPGYGFLSVDDLILPILVAHDGAIFQTDLALDVILFWPVHDFDVHHRDDGALIFVSDFHFVKYASGCHDDHREIVCCSENRASMNDTTTDCKGQDVLSE
mmetsp:Transcript_122897/g.183860  ORF Transcript_122897/g.183860 Transcript_122897/m.183860 type:complete len:252 (+) Transcript_122897:948-1703(+)